MNRLLSLSLVLAAAALLLIGLLAGSRGASVHAQQGDAPTPTPAAEPGPVFDVQVVPSGGKISPPKYPNLDSKLNHILEQTRTGRLTAQAAAASAPMHYGQSVAVTLDIIEGYADAIASYLEANGASPRNIGAEYIEAYVPVSLLAEASEQEGVVSIRSIVPPQPDQGSVVSGGVAAHGVTSWHAAGFKGRGVKIGVIDVSFKGFAGLMGSELPATVNARCYSSVGNFTANLSDCISTSIPERSRKHGTAVTEAIFDIAPQADYYIADTSSYSDLLNTVNWMASQGVDVINMSVSWTFDGPGDGTAYYNNAPLDSVDAAVTGGIIWINSAGNSARDSWYGAFADSDSDGVHEFNAAGNECNGVTIYLNPLEGFRVQLRWADSWGGASKDLNLYLIPESGSTVSLSDAVATSENNQVGAGNDLPYETIRLSQGQITNGEYCLAVKKSSGVAPSWIQLLVWGVSGDLQNYVSARSIGNPAESRNSGMLAAGAARFSNTNTIEGFSSRGPTTDNRTKPDIVGADGGTSRTWGTWFGTSQASPHVAGLAALVKQRFPTKSPSSIASYLKTNALPRGTVPNTTWGYGFAKLPALPTPVSLSTDATLSGLTLSEVDFGTFSSGTESYTASVAYSVSQTTVTPILSDSEASYVIKLGGVTDADSTVSLSVGANVITIEVTAEDGTTSKTYTVTVTKDAGGGEPTISTRNPPSTYRENGTSLVYTFRATDPQRQSITWTLEGIDRGDFTITRDSSGRGVLAFSTPPDFEAPADLDRENDYELAVIATDEDSHADRLSFTITVTDVNEGPEISRVGSAPGSVPENQEQMQVLARYTATDPEEGTVSRWRTSGTDGGDFVISEQGELRFRNTPDYERPADSNRDNAYVFTVQVSDGRYYGTFEETVTVTPVNEPPTITTTSSSATALRQNENQTSRLYTYRATDPEQGTITWLVGGTDGRYFAIDERGQFSFSESSPPDFEQPGDSGRDNVYNVTIEVRDDGFNTSSLPVTVTVREVNEGPEVTSGQSAFTISENQDLPNAFYTATDPEGGTVTRWNVGGRDGGDFTITQEGTLTFRNTPDYERPADSNRDNIYELQVRPYDGRYYGSFHVTVTVTPVNEPPTITTTSSSATALRQNENQTSRLYTYRATDPEQGTITWLVGGTDGRYFAIDERGQFSFSESSPPDFEQPGDSGRDNVYDVTIQARDDGGTTASLPVTVTVREVNEGPEVTDGQSAFTISENQDLPNAVYSGFDPEGGTVTRWTVGGRDGGDFTITQEGLLTFRNLPDYERPADSNRDNTYELQVRPYDGRYYGSFDVTVTVNDVNEPPTITTTSSSATALQQNENQTSRLYTYRATDPEQGTITWLVGGTDGRYFAIDERGQFSFSESSPPDFEHPGDSGRDNVYDVTIQARDDGFNTAAACDRHGSQ